MAQHGYLSTCEHLMHPCVTTAVLAGDNLVEAASTMQAYRELANALQSGLCRAALQWQV